MRRILFTLLILTSAFGSYAQNTGYEGKHFIIKTDLASLVLEKRPSFGLEMILSRTFSITGGMAFGSYEITQDYPSGIYPVASFFDANYLASQPKAQVKENTFFGEIRIYSNPIIPAPRGTYMFLNYQKSTATVDGTYYKPLVMEPDTEIYGYPYYKENSRVFVPYHYTEVDIKRYTFGMGFQDIYARRIAVDFHFGLCFSDVSTSEAPNSDRILSGIATRIGPNLVNLSPSNSSSESNGYRSGTFGLSFALKVGYLLF